MTDRFEELRTFVTIAEAGGVNAAAAKLGIARSAASRRLSDLERRLGVTLVARSTRSFALTDVGRGFHAESRRILKDLSALEAQAAGGTTGSDRIALAADPDLVPFLSGALTSFRAAHPDATLAIQAEANEDCDVVVSVGPSASGRTIGRIARVVVGSPAYLDVHGQLATPTDMDAHLGIAVAGANDEWTFRGGLAVRPRIVIEVSGVVGAVALARAGAGLAQAPEHLCSDGLGSGALVRVLERYEPTPLDVVAAGSATSPVAIRLVDHLAASLLRSG